MYSKYPLYCDPINACKHVLLLMLLATCIYAEQAWRSARGADEGSHVEDGGGEGKEDEEMDVEREKSLKHDVETRLSDGEDTDSGRCIATGFMCTARTLDTYT